MKHMEKERQDLLVTHGTRRATINGLEDQLGDVQEELQRTKQELMAQRTQYFQLRYNYISFLGIQSRSEFDWTH